MAHSFRSHFFHLVWSTLNREKRISKEIQPELYKYIGGIVRNINGKLIEIGGMQDHIHLLLHFSDIGNFSKNIRALKACSSKWINETNFYSEKFYWQEGYGSFSVSFSQISCIKNYIQNQEKHHKIRTFDEEYLLLLQKHDIIFDKRFVLG